MAINIKNDEVIELARRAADLTGESQVQVIAEALRQFIDQHQRLAQASRVEQVWHTLSTIDVRLDESSRVRLQQSMDSLYDESGLPA